MPLSSLRPAALARYRDLAWLAFKHGGPELRNKLGMGKGAGGKDHEHAKADATELADDLESMGPTFVKLGQLLSSRADLLPVEYLTALSRLQDDVGGFDPEEVRDIIEEDLGKPPEEVYARFDHEPMAAASLGQVHEAVLHDGTPVAVKVQRPQARQQMHDDLAALDQIARLVDATTDVGRRYRFTEIVKQLRKSLEEELDYQKEAQHLKVLRENLGDYDKLVIPEPFTEVSSPRVLTMRYIKGEKVTQLSEDRKAQLDGDGLTDTIFKAYMQQILDDGFFHADPHPGNVLVTEDDRLALLDLGMVGRTRQNMRDDLLRLIMAVSEGKADDAARIGQRIGEPRESFKPPAFRRGVGEAITEQYSGTVERMQLGQLLLEVCRVAGNTGLYLPPEVMLLGKTLMNLDEIGRVLAPDFDTNAAIRHHATHIVQHRLFEAISPTQIFANAIDLKLFLERLPERVNRMMDMVADNDLHLNIEAVDEDRLIAGIEKIANRVTVGLVLAALIVGAALMMRIHTAYTLFGYPALAIICFIIATCIGFGLVFNMLWDELKQKFGGHRRH